MAQGQGPVPMVVVATAGGGIRAAYWTATVLEQLESDLAHQGGVRPYLFAISGVSGGSVGAAAFDAALTKRDEGGCGAVKLPEAWTAPGDTACPIATNFLKEDFLAPALASLVFMDTPSSFLPDLGQGDRGVAIEQLFEDASRRSAWTPVSQLLSLREGRRRERIRGATEPRKNGVRFYYSTPRTRTPATASSRGMSG